MNELKIFENPVFGKVRVVEIDGETWFVAKDVAEALGYVNPSRSIQDHCNYVKLFKSNDSVGLDIPTRGILIIPESDVYALIFRSNLPSAEKFRRWICEEVLPSIRKHGAYLTGSTIEAIMANPEHAANMLLELARAQRRNRELSDQCLELSAQKEALEDAYWKDRYKVAFHDTFNQCGHCVTMAQMGMLITQNTGLKIGEKKLFHFCRNKGLICKGRKRCYEPTQWAVQNKLMKVHTKTYRYPGGDQHYRQTVVTPKGQQFILNIFLDGYRLC